MSEQQFKGELLERASVSPEISVMVRHDEKRYIEESGRCAKCGHLLALHDHLGEDLNKCEVIACPVCEDWQLCS